MSSARPTLRAVAVALLTLVPVAVLATSAGAASAPMLSIDAVDARDHHVIVDFTYAGKADPLTAKMSVGGESVPATVEKLSSSVPSDVVVVLDNSATMHNGTLQLALDQIPKFSAGSSSIAQSGVITTGGMVKVAAGLAATKNLGAQVGEQFADGPNLLWDGAARAISQLAQQRGHQRNLVLIVGSIDGGSVVATPGDVIEKARAAEVTVHVIGIAGRSVDVEDLQRLVATTGGSVLSQPDTDLAAAVDAVTHRVDSQFRLRATGDTVRAAEVEALRVAVGGDAVDASFRSNQRTVGAANLQFVVQATPDGGLFGAAWIKWLIVALGSLAVAGVTFALAHLLVKRKDGLDFTLRHYDESFAENSVHVGDSSMAKTAFLKRAVAVTGGFAEKRGLLIRVEELLERADLPLRAAEALFFYVATALLVMIVAWVATGVPLAALGTALLAMLLPGFVVDFLARRRKKKFVALLPDMLALLSGTLRAGYSVGQGVEAVSTEVSEPMGKELRRAVTEARLGRPLDEALTGVAKRMDSEDFEWAVLAIRIQREVGGNLAELLMTVADTMTQRERLRRDVSALTAEGRVSAIVIGMLPPGLAAVMYVINPEYITQLFAAPGIYLLVAAGVSMLIGFVWMKKCVEVEV